MAFPLMQVGSGGCECRTAASAVTKSDVFHLVCRQLAEFDVFGRTRVLAHIDESRWNELIPSTLAT